MPSSANRDAPLVILMYHGIVAEPLKVDDWCFVHVSAFEQQIAYLKERFDVIPLGQVATRLPTGFDRPTAAITFDDGFQNTHDVALPILRRLDLSATIFICTDLIDTDDTIWFCRLHRALTETALNELEWSGMGHDLSGREARARTSATIQRLLKQRSPNDLLRELRHIIMSVGQDPDSPLEPDSPYRILTRNAVQAMGKSGLIEIGAHSRSHPILTRLSSDERRDQIEGSASAVETLTDRSCRMFAYPNGLSGDYDEECLHILAACGVDTAVTAVTGTNHARTSLLELKRHGVGADLTIDAFKVMLE